MKAVVYEDIEKVRVDDVDEPAIEQKSDAIVRITTAAICGSDLHFFHGKAPMMPGEQLGHEGIGLVEKVGDEVKGFKEGDRVVISFNVVCGECWFCKHGQTALCDDYRNLGGGLATGSLGGTQAERVRVPSADVNLLKVPDDMDDERALFVGDILTTGFYGAEISDIKPGDTVAVIGAGPVGFFAAQAARLHDPAEVLVLDMQADRLQLAEKVGAIPVNVAERNAQMAVADRTEGRGADVVIEAVGAIPAFESALEVVRSGGTICVLGMYTTESIELQLGMIWMRTLRFVMSGFCPISTYWEDAMKAVADGRIDPLPIISHTLSLDEAPKGYELFDKREATKVLLKP
jgi:threonine dehydrogenase-like Zn-dependent dehydrogenase